MSTSTSPSDPVYDVVTVTLLLKTCTSVDLFRAQLVDPPPRPEERVGFITFFDPGWSILVLRELVADKRIFYPQTWYANEPFARLEEHPRYRQLRMEAVEDSFGKAFAEQQALVAPDEEIPTARVVMMGMAIHFLATGDRLLLNYYVRCFDQRSGNGRVVVGRFDSGGFSVGYDWDGYRHNDLGLASSRKF